jgi:signal peptidase II
LLDQGSKAVFVVVPALGRTAVSFNTGISFGLFAGLPPATTTIALSTLLLAGGWIFRSIWQRHPLESGVLFGAAVSNLVDRLVFGGVRDFLPLPIVYIQNNIADWLVCGALFAIATEQIWQKKGRGGETQK